MKRLRAMYRYSMIFLVLGALSIKPLSTHAMKICEWNAPGAPRNPQVQAEHLNSAVSDMRSMRS